MAPQGARAARLEEGHPQRRSLQPVRAPGRPPARGDPTRDAAPQAARTPRLEEGHPWRLACGGLQLTLMGSALLYTPLRAMLTKRADDSRIVGLTLAVGLRSGGMETLALITLINGRGHRFGKHTGDEAGHVAAEFGVGDDFSGPGLQRLCSRLKVHVRAKSQHGQALRACLPDGRFPANAARSCFHDCNHGPFTPAQPQLLLE